MCGFVLTKEQIFKTHWYKGGEGQKPVERGKKVKDSRRKWKEGGNRN